jgi:tetratricopeptide (TPR) repeat protein
MSPEQARGEPLDARTDLFSLGSVLFEMATSQPPFGGRSTAEVFAALLMKDPPPVSSLNPGMPRALDPVIAKLLAKNRDERYATAEELLADLEAIPASTWSSSVRPAVAATPVSTVRTVSDVPPDRKPSRTPLLIFAVLLLLIVAALALLLYHPGKLGTKPGAATGAATPAADGAAKPAALKDAIIVADFVNKTGDPVFDSTLNQALRVQLGQSPVLDIISQQHLRQSLQYLGRKQDEAITPQIAREIGEREGVKAILTGTIAPVGNAFLLTLGAQNTATGDDIASEDATAPDKEHVLEALNKTATGMRAKLGESLSSIQRLNAPFGQATTPSLEAFRAYALGDEAHQKGNDIPEAEDHYKRALELDPKLAMAWARLGVIYLNSGQVSKANEYFTHAYQLSGNVSEREKLYISGHYYSTVVGNLNKSIETLQVATQEYPLQMDNFVNLGVYYLTDGDVEKSDEANRRALALQPDDAIALENGVGDSVALGKLDDARRFVEQIQRLKLNGTALYVSELQYYAVLGDWDGFQRVITETAGRPDQFSVTATVSGLEMERGQFSQAHSSSLRAADQAATVNEKDAQAAGILYAAGSGWPIGQCQGTEDAAKQALKLDKGKATESLLASTLALCGEDKAAVKALNGIEKKYPQDTIIQEVVVPQGLAILALKNGDPRHAIELLERVRAHDDASLAPYFRGLAYLQLKDAQNAIASFQDATRRRGVAYYVGSPYALSELGLGRAYAMAGDKVNAKKAYAAFFAEWNNAEAGLPVIAEAKKEYSQL